MARQQIRPDCPGTGQLLRKCLHDQVQTLARLHTYGGTAPRHTAPLPYSLPGHMLDANRHDSRLRLTDRQL